MAAAAGLTAWAALTPGTGEELVAVLGVGGTATLAVALLGRWPDLLPWALALIGGQYAASLLLRDGGIDGLAPLYAAGVLVAAELAYWALERGPTARAVVLRRLAALLGVAVGTAAVGAAVLAASEGVVGSSLLLESLGLIAAAGTVGVVAWLAYRLGPR